MKRRMLLMWIGVVGIAFAQQAPKPRTGVDTFNVDTRTGSNPCDQSYTEVIEKVSEEDRNNQAQYSKDQNDCQGSTSCLAGAQKRYTARLLDTNNEKSLARTNRTL